MRKWLTKLKNLTRPDQLIVRNSSLELLRIIGMLIIVAHHFSVHGGFNFPATSITLNRLWQQFIYMGGSLGNNIFVMLSGYFLIKSHDVNYRRLFELWFRIFFYSVIIYCLLMFSGLEALSLKTMLKVLMPVTRNQWWFASTYFVMYLIHPYINRLLLSFTREDYRKFLLSLGIYWCIIPTLAKADFGANQTINFIYLYSLAGYVRLHAEDFENRKYILYGLACICINFLSVITFDIIGLKYSLFAREAYHFLGMMRPFTIIAVLCFLVGFKNLNIPHNKIINLVASATFGVYLIHDNKFVRPFLWHNVFRNASFQDSPYLIPYSIAVILIVYISCTLIELLRSKIFRTLSRGILS